MFTYYTTRFKDIEGSVLINSKGVKVEHFNQVPNVDPQYSVKISNGSDCLEYKFSDTGDLESLNLNADSNRPLIQRDRRFIYYVDKKRAEAILRIRTINPEDYLEEALKYFSGNLDQRLPAWRETIPFLNYIKLRERFEHLYRSQSATDIVPTQTPLTIVIKATDGCHYACLYCPESRTVKRLKIPTREKYEQELSTTRQELTDILGKNLKKTNTLFVNTADILFLDEAIDFNSQKALSLALKYFPWIQRIETFMGSDTTLKRSEDEQGLNFEGKKYSTKYLRSLQEVTEGRLSVKLGLETAHTIGSELVGKPISYEHKRMAGNLIKEAGIRFEVILQLGLLGESFCKNGKEYSSLDALNKTIQWLNETEPDSIHLSIFQLYQELPIARLRSTTNNGRNWIKPYEPDKEKEQIMKEKRFLLDGLNPDLQKRVIDNYERILPSDNHSIAHFIE